MAIEKAEGIILRIRPQGETSKLLQLYTLQRGRVTLIAKGARLPRSRFGGALDLCNRVAIVYYRKEGRDIQFLSQVDILERFPRVQSDIARLAVAEQAFELLLVSGAVDEANPRLYQLVLELLRGLQGAEKGFRSVGRSFELHFVDLLGFRPTLERCRSCGATEAGDRILFELDRGGYVCERCRPASTDVYPMPGKVLEWARWLQTVRPQNASVPVPRGVGEALDRWLRAYLAYHVEGTDRLRSYGFANDLRRGSDRLSERTDSGRKDEEG